MHEIRNHALTDDDVKGLLMADLRYALASLTAFAKHADGRWLDRSTAHDLHDQATDIEIRVCEICTKLATAFDGGEDRCDDHLMIRCDYCREWDDINNMTTIAGERTTENVCRPCYEAGKDW